jgi:hypothetical protein
MSATLEIVPIATMIYLLGPPDRSGAFVDSVDYSLPIWNTPFLIKTIRWLL